MQQDIEKRTNDMNRKNFITGIGALAALSAVPVPAAAFLGEQPHLSAFARRLRPIGRALESDGYYVWCNSPIQGPDGRIHVFFSRWTAKKGMSGWINGSEIARAVAATPEGPFEYAETVLTPRGGTYWDATTCHNPHIGFVDGKYCLLFMGNSNGKTNTKRIGMATAPSPEGPWTRPDEPLLLPGPEGAWDDHCTTNPSFIKSPAGKYLLYYKSWNTAEYTASKDPVVRGNRKYGLAVADKLEGPYLRVSADPVIDFSAKGNNSQFEDAFIWYERGKYRLLARDMGVFSHEDGLYMESRNGIRWSSPEIAFRPIRTYLDEPPAPPHLKRYGRLERPQVLFLDNKPAYLFCASQGGKYMTASAFILKIT
jgi:hypothetical protein